MALKMPEAGSIVKVVLIGLILLYVVTQFVNLQNIGVEGATIFKTPTNVTDTFTTVIKFVLIAAVVIVAFGIAEGWRDTLSRKKFVSYIVIGVILYLIWTYVLPQITGWHLDLDTTASMIRIGLGG